MRGRRVAAVTLDAEVQRLIDAALVSRDHDIAVALQRIDTLTTRADLTADRLDDIEVTVFIGTRVGVFTDTHQSPVLPWEPSPPRVAGQAGPAGDSARPAGPTTPEGRA
jgi:hypothetical protein